MSVVELGLEPILSLFTMSSMAQLSEFPAIKLSSPATHEFWEIPVLYEDEQLLAVDKPTGLALTPNPADPNRPSLLVLLHQGIAAGKPWAVARKLSFLMYAHRLDTEATGILLLAKAKPVLTRLLDWFGSERATLTFVALAFGEAAENQFSIEAKLAVHPAKPGLIHVNQNTGKRARTSVDVLERFKGATLVRCVPYANRPHQVRVHLARVGLRVMGDEAYGAKPLWLSRLKHDFRLKPGHTERPLIGHASIHATRLDTLHPITEQPFSVESPWPKDLQVALKYLRKHAAAS
jgi:RluA family pseudouridine synthase